MNTVIQRRIRVDGLNLSRFLLKCGENGISLADVRHPMPRRMTAVVHERDIPPMADLASSGGWQLTVKGRVGAGRLVDALRNRWLLAVLIALAILLMMLSTQIIWSIRIEPGDAGAYTADILEAVTDHGVRTPMLRRAIDLGELRDALEWRYPHLAWVECGFRGVTLVVRPVAGVMPVRNDDIGPCDLIAERDGVIHHIVTRAGTPVVNVGDVVRAGDVLIRGEERTADGEVRPVAARGSVTARIWRSVTVQMSLAEVLTEPTGQTQTVWTVRTPWFDLWPMAESPFAQQDVAVREITLNSLFLPVVFHLETRIEAEFIPKMRENESVKAEIQTAAIRKLREKAVPGESFIDIWGNCSMIEDGNVSAYAIGELLVEIAVRSTEMAVPDEQR